jgi:hypothetical protein
MLDRAKAAGLDDLRRELVLHCAELNELRRGERTGTESAESLVVRTRSLRDRLFLTLDALESKIAGTTPDNGSFAGRLADSLKIFVSYRWTPASIAIVDQIENELRESGVKLLRDRNEVAYRDSFRDFMRRLAAGDAIVVVLSKAYLESANCMFELTEIARRGDLRKRTYPIVLDDANIYQPEGRLAYVRHWQQRAAELEEQIRQVGIENVSSAQESLREFAGYRATIDGILGILADMNSASREGVTGIVGALHTQFR